MANYFNLTLDTTAPSNPSLIVAGGAAYTSAQLVSAAISVGDGSTTGYQMKIWGNVDTANDPNIQASEAASVWITYATSKQIKLSSTDGSKTLYLKVRDDVFNESSQTSTSITLDSSVPTVTISGPDVSKISKIAGKSVAAFSFTVDASYVEYKVKVVSAAGSTNDTGTTIPTTNGSTNMAATGSFTGTTPINCTINGTDLANASAGDGAKIIKVFVKDAAGNWSV